MKKGNISDDEIATSKNFIINSLNAYDDDQFEMIAYYQGEKLMQSEMEINDYKERIMSLTKEDVVRAFSNVTLDTVYFITGEADAYGKDN